MPSKSKAMEFVSKDSLWDSLLNEAMDSMETEDRNKVSQIKTRHPLPPKVGAVCPQASWELRLKCWDSLLHSTVRTAHRSFS